MFMVMKKHVTQSNSVAHWCVFNSFFLTNMELWRNKTDQASATQTMLFVFVSVSSRDLLKIRKIYSLFKLLSTLQLECEKDKSIDVQNFAVWFTLCPLFVCGCFSSFLESHHIIVLPACCPWRTSQCVASRRSMEATAKTLLAWKWLPPLMQMSQRGSDPLLIAK